MSGALTQVEPQFPTVLAEFCQVNVMVAFLWHKDLVKFLEGSSLKMAENEAYPSMLRSAKGDCLMLVHIDDILIVGC